MRSFSVFIRAGLLLPLVCNAAMAGTETVLFTFDAPAADGSVPSGRFPYTGLLGTQSGRVFYGVTSTGGVLSDGQDAGGTLFKIAKSGSGPGAVYTVLHSFDFATEGVTPGKTLATDGKAIYGTTEGGGLHNAGAAFQWLPPAPGQTKDRLTILYSLRWWSGWRTAGGRPVQERKRYAVWNDGCRRRREPRNGVLAEPSCGRAVGLDLQSALQFQRRRRLLFHGGARLGQRWKPVRHHQGGNLPAAAAGGRTRVMDLQVDRKFCGCRCAELFRRAPGVRFKRKPLRHERFRWRRR